jgi:deoxyribonuclease-4
MLIGAHESTAGGLHEAFGRAVSDGAEAVQIFTKSNRMWAAKAIAPEEAKRFRAEGERTRLLDTCTVHASYLINLASEPGEMREKAIGGLVDELRRCELIGLDKLVLHPGSSADIEAGCARIGEGLASALEQAGGDCRILLETAAGQGAALGRSFEELKLMREAVPTKLRERVTFCLDTCHVFAAGYDVATAAGYTEAMDKFERLIGLSLIEAFHLNDSKKPLGCNVDRHENPGKGCIGADAFQRLVNDARFENVPGFLELPPEENLACLAEMRGWRGAASVGTPSTKGASGKSRVARPLARD